VSNEPRRDESVERLLRTSIKDVLPGPTTACIEAETLAAWADGALTVRERESVEAHVSSCGNCQAFAAAFARSLPEPASALGSVAPGFWTPWRVGWIAAVGATAVAVTVWISRPRLGEETPTIQTMASRDMAPEPGPMPIVPQAQQEAAATTPSLPPARAAEGPAAVMEKGQSLRREVAAPPSPTDVTQSRTDAVAPASPPLPGSAPGASADRAAAAAPAMPASPPAVQSRVDVVDAAPLVRVESGERSTTVRPQQLQSLPSATRAGNNFLGYVAMQPGMTPSTGAVTQRRVGGGGQSDFMLDGLSASDTGTAVVAEVIPQAAVQGGQGRGEGRGVNGTAATGRISQPAGAEVAPTAPAVARWRIFENGQVDRVTTNAPAGQRVVFDRPVFITAGSAPNAFVCWIVGHGGAVARTVDAEHFQSVTFPETADLRSVTAASALQASVTTVSGVTYVTTDGGATWRQFGR